GRRQRSIAARLLRAIFGERCDRIRRRCKEPWTIVQRRRDRLCSSGERALLRVAQKTLELAHVFVAEPWQREKHRQHEQQLRANAERDPHGSGCLSAVRPPSITDAV